MPILRFSKFDPKTKNVKKNKEQQNAQPFADILFFLEFIYIYIYILSGCKKRSERFLSVFCANVFWAFSSKNKTVGKRSKNVSRKRSKNGQENVQKTVSLSILPATRPPWRHFFAKSGHGILTVKNVQKTFKKRWKNVGAREVPLLKRRPGGVKVVSALQLSSQTKKREENVENKQVKNVQKTWRKRSEKTLKKRSCRKRSKNAQSVFYIH